MGPRGPSAYFLFAEEQREIVKAELQKHDGKVGVAAIGKEIGARWQMLTDEQKKTYKEKAQELKGIFQLRLYGLCKTILLFYTD